MRRCMLLVVLCVFVCAAGAQEGKAPWEEFRDRIKAGQEVAALGADVFGDQVALTDGALSFSVTDVEIPGNSALRVAFARTYSVVNRKYRPSDSPLADWRLDVPNISGVFAPDWTVGRPASGARCSRTDSPTQPLRDYRVNDFWHGNTLSLPAGGGGELLVATEILPDPALGGSFFWTTPNHVRLKCLPSIKNGTGEGFMAVAPDGTRYWFDWMAQYVEPNLVMRGRHESGGGIDPNPVVRRRNVLYATRVEDRFGNWVKYTYTNQWNRPAILTRIAASDGRQIDIGYDGGRIDSVQANGRAWGYRYGRSPVGKITLTHVQLPDKSAWSYGFGGFTESYMDYRVGNALEPSRGCSWSENPIGRDRLPVQPITGTVEHPSGAVGSFRIGIVRHGRSNVPLNCRNVTTKSGYPPGTGNDPSDDANLFVTAYDSFTLLEKTLSGPGLDTLRWSYAYDSDLSIRFTPGATHDYPVCNAANPLDCRRPTCLSDECAGSQRTTVTAPDGSWTRYSHGNSYRYNEGKLLKVETGAAGASASRVATRDYDLAMVDRAYPARTGRSLQLSYEGFTNEYPRPLLKTAIVQQGVTFSGARSSLDVFARPGTIVKSSTLGYSKTEVTKYHDDWNDWVLGQAHTITVNGVQASRTDYDSKAMPSAKSVFGNWQQWLSYHANGTLATHTDANNNVTRLNQWTRGIPKQVIYPDGSSQSAGVNPDGTIASTTDENGFTTSYAYDAMGRLTRITYPAGDSVAWTPLSQTFEHVSAAEYGIGDGHWRQTVKQGNYRKYTYFDALWQPLLVREFDAADVAGTQRFTRYAYDHGGRATFASYPSASSNPTAGTWSHHDALGRLDTVSQDSEHGLLTTRYAYLSGFRTQMRNPRGLYTTTSFLAFDTPETSAPVRIEAPEGVVTTITRNEFGEPTEVTRTGN